MPLTDIGREGNADVLSLLIQGTNGKFMAFDLENPEVTSLTQGNIAVVDARTWSDISTPGFSEFTVSSTGLITYDAAALAARVVGIDVLARVVPISGNNQDLELGLLLNGTEIPSAGSTARVASSGAGVMLPIVWLLQMQPGDTLQLGVINDTSAINVIVDRIRIEIEG